MGEYNNMSPKLAILVAAFALVGAITIPTTAFAQDDESQNASVDIERNNEISQSIEQSQEACTNEAVAEISDNDEEQEGGVNSASVSQGNECVVTQSQSATNEATIVDDSENNFNIQGKIVGCPAQFENCRGIDVVFPNDPCDIFTSDFIRELCRG
jgi:hypothetical protein